MDKNIFDDMTVLPATDTVIDEASVAENTKADVDAVLSRVYSSIGKKKKRRPVRRLIAAAAAAVILICIFSCLLLRRIFTFCTAALSAATAIPEILQT